MTREENIKHVLANKELLMAKKTSALKFGDVIFGQYGQVNEKTEIQKQEGADSMDLGKLKLSLCINTTNVIDSHMDCHIPGLWKKSLSETKILHLLQEHEMEFEYVIADTVNNEFTANTKTIAWNKFGVSYEGSTQALVFDVTIDAKRNPFMFEQYKNGWVLNHSVGMRYVKLFLCVDSNEPSYASEKANWDKYYPQVVNKEVADTKGYFWAVTEAKVIEGSAVVKGSNSFTPVISITELTDKGFCDMCQEETSSLSADNGETLCKACGTRRKEAVNDDTSKNENEPSKDTQRDNVPTLDWNDVISNF